MLNDIEAWKLILGSVTTIAAAWLVYRGATRTASASRAGATQTSHVAAQESALKAWEGLLQPHIEEVARLRTELRDEREERAEHDRRVERRRIEAKSEVDEQMAEMDRKMAALSAQVGEWKRLAQTIARWATRLRDEVLRLGGEVPATPEDLLTLQAIEDAERTPPPAAGAAPSS